MRNLSGFFKEQPVLKIFYFLAAGVCASGLIPGPFALVTGLLLALVLGNPLKKLTNSASKYLLRWSIVGLGFGMHITEVMKAGQSGFIFAAATIVGTLGIGILIGRLLKIESNTSILVSSGTAICGGSAIAAVGPVIGADTKSMSVSLITIFILNAVALFIFPWIGHTLDMSQYQFGMWSAVAIHDTSSVVGASSNYGEEALQVATTVKLTRALWIIPVALFFALIKKGKKKKLNIPWFILFFIVATLIASFLPQGEPIYKGIKIVAKHGLVLTLFLIGASLTREEVKAVGFRPMIQGLILWIIISIAGLFATLNLV